MRIPGDEGRKTDRSIRESAWNVIVRSIPFVHSATLPRIKTLISGCTTGYTYSYRLPLPHPSSSLFRFCTFYPLSLRFIPLCCSFLSSSLSLSLLSTSYYLSFLLPSSQYSLSLSLWLVLVLESPLGVLQERVPTGETEKKHDIPSYERQCYLFVFVFRKTVKLYGIRYREISFDLDGVLGWWRHARNRRISSFGFNSFWIPNTILSTLKTEHEWKKIYFLLTKRSIAY